MDLAAEGYKTVSRLLLATLITDALPPLLPKHTLGSKKQNAFGFGCHTCKAASRGGGREAMEHLSTSQGPTASWL